MSPARLNRYEIKVSKTDYKCISVNGKPTDHFINPDTNRKTQKLYVLKNRREVYYVGITSLSMSSRLRSGYRAKGEHGYYGYPWIGEISGAELLVWGFAKSLRIRAEAIEGEVVYLIRNKTGRWPRYQMEIHFHSDASAKEKQIAETLADACLR